MSDTSGTIPAPSAAPEPPAAPAPEPAAGGDGQQPVDYSTHPVWGRALEPIPDVLRGPLLETIKASEAETQKAIEKARTETVPADWRALAAEAQQMGVTVEQLAEAYRGQALMAEQLQADPDAFLAEMKQNVDQLVANGQITRRQGADAMRAAQAAADEQSDDLLTDEQKQLKELQAWKQQQEQRDQQRQQQEQQAQQQQEMEAAAEREAQQFFTEFDAQMIAAGYAAREGNEVVSVIPVETLQMIAETAGGLVDRGAGHADAIRQAAAHVKRQIEAAGGKLGPAPRPTTPVIGGSSAMPAAQATTPGQPRTSEERQAAALAEVMRLAGQQ